MTWQPNSWRSFPICQVPEYPDATRLQAVEEMLASRPPLVFAGEAQSLQQRLGAVANGEAVVMAQQPMMQAPQPQQVGQQQQQQQQQQQHMPQQATNGLYPM